MRERWRPVAGHPYYEVSDRGRVRSLSHWRPHNRHKGAKMWWKGRILKPGGQTSGHLFVVLEGQKGHRVHRLVALAFIGPPPFKGALVRHKDGVPDNNQYTNLAWGTQKNNMEDAALHGRIPRGAQRPNAKLKPHHISSIRRLRDKATLVAIAARFSVSPATIHDVLSGRSWRHV